MLPFEAEIPVMGPNSFGSVRKHDVHTGVDLFCQPGQIVHAMEEGVVVNVLRFTGFEESPWWNDTLAVMIKGISGVILYGEIDTHLEIGHRVVEGEDIGRVLTVLKNDKGKPQTMLHVELYHSTATDAVWWKHNEPKPSLLLDPTTMLLKAKNHSKVVDA